jgi:hypothetical protein
MNMWSRVVAVMARHHLWCVFIYLTVVELLVFAPIVGRIGFYLDDWGMLSGLVFAPNGPLAKINWVLFNDPKTIIRPLQALHFGGLFAIAGTKPAIWHVFNGLLEILAAWLLYACLFIFGKNRMVSLLTAALFLLCPTHDCTHYWVLCSSATLSMVFWLSSLASTMLAVRLHKPSLHGLSFLLFAASLFNYELFVPLAAINVLAAWWMGAGDKTKIFARSAIMSSLLLSGGFALCIASYLFWVRVIVPKLGVGYIHPIHFSAATMFDTVAQGIAVSLPVEQSSFLLTQTINAFDPTALLPCLAVALLTGILIFAFVSTSADSSPASGSAAIVPSRSLVMELLVAVLIIIPLSYTVFGLSPEYRPTLLTIINRVNYGASIGTCMLYALAMMATGRFGSKRIAAQGAVVAIAAGVLLSCFVLSDRAMAKPWELSWTMQKHVANLVKTHPDICLKASCVMLFNSPRYVMWAPVFDGTWDFENLGQVTLKRKDLHFGVVSERLQLNDNHATDISSEFVCGKYPFRGMVALVAPQSLFIPINSSQEFISCVQQHGFGFGLDKSMPIKWQEELIAASDRRRPQPF